MTKKIEYFKSEAIGKGLPFAIARSPDLIEVEDIYVPSLRDFHVVFRVKKGTGSYVVDFQEYDFAPGMIILLPKDQLHFFHPFDQGEVDMDSVIFDPSFIYRNNTDLKHLLQFTSSGHEKGRQVLTVTPETDQRIEYYFSEMEKIYYTEVNELLPETFYHYLCLLLIQCELLQEKQQTQVDNQNEMILNFLSLLEQNFRKEFKVDFYAEKLNLSEKAFSRLIKNHYKASPKAVIDERRILEIKRQLQGTSKPGKTIAYELNFGEPTNMFKYFKKHTGITPKEFRDNNKS